MHDTLKAPVAIVGGGPVGMMLALFLDRHGVPVVLFNSERTTRWHPKGNTHNARTMEHYRRLGLSDGIRRLGLPADHPRDVAYFTRLNGWELARLDMPAERERLQAARQAPDTDQVPEPLLRANQMYVERFLLDHLRTRPGIQLRFGWRVDDFQQDADGVSLHAVDSAGQAADEHWRADYLVGCDGGHSFVRRRLGIGYIGPDGSTGGFLSGRMFSSYVRIPDLHRRLLPDRKAWMYNVVAPEGRMLLISLDGADEFLLMTQARSHDEMPQDDAVIRAIQRGIGEPVEVSVLAHAVWHGGLALVAERFADRRVLLAGDATHLFSPTGGFGMNTGIDGAANLAWKLAAAVQGWAGDGLLATYELERRPVTLRNTHAARRLTQRVGQVDVPAEVEDPGPPASRRGRAWARRCSSSAGSSPPSASSWAPATTARRSSGRTTARPPRTTRCSTVPAPCQAGACRTCGSPMAAPAGARCSTGWASASPSCATARRPPRPRAWWRRRGPVAFPWRWSTCRPPPSPSTQCSCCWSGPTSTSAGAATPCRRMPARCWTASSGRAWRASRPPARCWAAYSVQWADRQPDGIKEAT